MGDIGPGGPTEGHNAHIHSAGHAAIARIEAACRELGLEARAGMFEEESKP